MSEATANASYDSDTTLTPAQNDPPKKARKSKTKAKKIAKKATKVPSANGSAKAPKSGKESKRLRLFKLLAKYPAGLGNAKIREKLDTDSIARICRDEAVAGRLKVTVAPEGEQGKRFTLSAAGKKALEKGTVDSNAAPVSEGW